MNVDGADNIKKVERDAEQSNSPVSVCRAPAPKDAAMETCCQDQSFECVRIGHSDDIATGNRYFNGNIYLGYVKATKCAD